MKPSNDNLITGSHPHLLPWYVAGAVDRSEAALIESHVSDCASCSDEVEALRSMRRTLLQTSITAHLPAEELVSYECGELDDRPDRRQLVEGHLEGCSECREDVAALRHVGQQTDDAGERAKPRGSFVQWWMFVAAAVVLSVPLLTWKLVSPPDSSIVTVLQPQLRSTESTTALPGEGPWTIMVVLPGLAPDGSYNVRIRSDEGELIRDAGSHMAREGRLTLPIGSGLAEGSFVLVLVESAADSTRPYRYRFNVGDLATRETD